MQMHHRMLLLFLLICGLLAPRTMIQAQTPQIEITPIPEDPIPTAPQNLYLPLITNGAQAHDSTESPQSGEVIPGQYIVVFKDDLVTSASVSAVAAEMVSAYNGNLLQTYEAALNGFAVYLPTEVITDALTAYQQDSRVAFIEQDRVITLDPVELAEPMISEAITSEVSSSATDATQLNPPWGLDRIDQRSLPLNTRYNYVSTGTGVRVYIIDTGIRISHSEFQGRATYGYDFVDGDPVADDCRGHGTHVAGTVGGRTYGVAKGVQLIAVRVSDCYGTGSISLTIKGVDWVTDQKRSNPTIPMVANMSLGGIADDSSENAVRKSIALGITYVVAAGNSNVNACNGGPARLAEAITVSATGISDQRAIFSTGAANFGPCVDLFAPGLDITSASRINDTAAARMSGTSMAAPHVTGMAALYLQSHPNALPAEVANALNDSATVNVVGGPGTNTPNRLLYSGLIPFNKLSPINGASQAPTTLTLTWEPSAGAVQYGYCIDTVINQACGQGVDNFTRISGNRVSLSLQPNTTYEWQVRAYTPNGEWLPGNGSGRWWTFTTQAASAPGPFNKTYPTNNATTIPTSINLTWGASAGASYYLVCIDTTADSLCNGSGDNTNFIRVNGTSYPVNLALGTTYSWQVRAVGANGNWTPGNGSGGWWTFTTGSYPGPFNKTYPINNATGVPTSINLTWNASAGASYYLLCIDTTADLLCNGADNHANFTRVNGTSYYINLAPGTTYSWQVRAMGANGNWTPGNGSGQWWLFRTR